MDYSLTQMLNFQLANEKDKMWGSFTFDKIIK